MIKGVNVSIVRVAMLLLFVVAAGFTGGRLEPSSLLSQREDQRSAPQLLPTTEPEVVAYPTLSPTSVKQQAQAPTRVVTVVPTDPAVETPTTSESIPGRGDFSVPENTTGASIIIERGPSDKAYVALTFDAGEGRGYTTEILDLLKAHGLKASFGTTGVWAKENPDLINRIVDEGHLLFNHSESHQSWTGKSPMTEPLTDEQRTAELLGADQAVEEVANWSMKPFWRPPYGDYDANGQALLASQGYDYTFWWTCDSLGWNGSSAADIAEWCAPDTSRGGNGAIILMHVSQEQDYLALEQIIAEYESAGFEFVTMDKMIAN